MKRIWINKAKSFKEAENFDRDYYEQMTPEERLSIMQELREIYVKFPKNNQKGLRKNAGRKRLRRVIKII